MFKKDSIYNIFYNRTRNIMKNCGKNKYNNIIYEIVEKVKWKFYATLLD